ncbi:hypothetical protein [Rubrimonas cliftonensis]|uniref:Uncharacterized protein n=1 Tax=Rubrimonas cliftonensis TaxID=89524 RepID=A0A1H3VHA5_9RHOB|nr:hypothetical protein [Rubrimonas cliftonensis]SDZ74149.1 hypothetical protein SAMN05444370_10198 [Rubrimonas cliftonensis]
MIWKILTLAGVALLAWSALNRLFAGGVDRSAGRREPGRSVADLEQCAACGAWRAPGESCGCDAPPTP